MKGEREMKMLLVSHCTDLSGANKSFLSIIELLRRDNEITVLINSENGQLIEMLDKLGVEHIYCKYDWWFAHPRNNMAKKIYRYLLDSVHYHNSRISSDTWRKLRSKKFDIVYTNTSTIDIGAKIADHLNIPHIWHIREFGREDFGFIPLTSKKYRMRMFNKAEKIIVISEALGKKYRDIIQKEKVVVVYNGFEIHKLCSVSQCHDLSKRINILVSGQVCAAKGQDQAILAVKVLHSMGLPVQLHIAGEIDYSFINPILAECSEYEKWLVLHGQVSDMYELRNSMDIELVCSKSEAFGRVTLEAMLHRIPVIGTRTGGTPELISHEKNGLLFDYGSLDQLVNCIRQLADDVDLYNRIMDEAMNFASQFTIERTVDQVKETIYKVRSIEK